MLLDARWVHRTAEGAYVYEAHRPVPANGGLVEGPPVVGGSGGPATRRYVLWLLSPVEVDAEDADAAAAAGPAAVHALLHDTPGILEFDAQEVDDD
jgi:hypothetical protein